MSEFVTSHRALLVLAGCGGVTAISALVVTAFYCNFDKTPRAGAKKNRTSETTRYVGAVYSGGYNSMHSAATGGRIYVFAPCTGDHILHEIRCI